MPASSTPTVLLLEDSVDERNMYAEGLRALGYRVVATGDGADAAALAHTTDVLVTDLRLGASADGVDIIQQVRADPRTRTMPAIILTGYASERRRKEAMAAGCSLFLLKPCLPETLAERLRWVLGNPQD